MNNIIAQPTIERLKSIRETDKQEGNNTYIVPLSSRKFTNLSLIRDELCFVEEVFLEDKQPYFTFWDHIFGTYYKGTNLKIPFVP